MSDLPWTEILKTVALFLGIFVPAIAVFYQYRAAERKSQSPTVPPSATVLATIGGGVAQREEVIEQTEALKRVADAMEKLAQVTERVQTKADRRAELFGRGIDELADLRKAIENLRHDMKMRAT